MSGQLVCFLASPVTLLLFSSCLFEEAAYVRTYVFLAVSEKEVSYFSLLALAFPKNLQDTNNIVTRSKMHILLFLFINTPSFF
ncbi:hypothetical protein [Borreliella garinii]|uniref:hypothetical protein n=1 Tax=Borreliella garinii TaxID=29519 RepID=UPI001F394992|nr:hypothetical protein [Borreliella garinii]